MHAVNFMGKVLQILIKFCIWHGPYGTTSKCNVNGEHRITKKKQGKSIQKISLFSDQKSATLANHLVLAGHACNGQVGQQAGGVAGGLHAF